ncbi:MAG: 20S proteasome subunit A/B [Actinomycetota bacterium]
MTYCLAMRLDDGLLFLSDTRTNAGVDHVGTYRKLHVFEPDDDRVIVIQSAGNLATTQEVLDRIGQDLDGPGESLANVDELWQAALYVGRVANEVVARHQPSLTQAGASGTATFIVGGQIDDGEPDILLVYPEGNYIRASDDRPYLQIGERKYGKSWLDLAVRSNTDLDTAAKVALSSMAATALSNLSVGPPYDLGIVRRDSHAIQCGRIEGDSPFLDRVKQVWADHLNAAIDALPRVEAADITALAPDWTSGQVTRPRS